MPSPDGRLGLADYKALTGKSRFSGGRIFPSFCMKAKKVQVNLRVVTATEFIYLSLKYSGEKDKKTAGHPSGWPAVLKSGF
jgi:hypothetical protein